MSASPPVVSSAALMIGLALAVVLASGAGTSGATSVVATPTANPRPTPTPTATPTTTPTATPGPGTFLVNSFKDAVDAKPGDGVCATASGECTLRAAVQEANALPGPNAINLPAGTYNLTIPGTNEEAAATGDLDVTGDLTLTGAGAATTIIDGDRLDRILDILPGAALSISRLTISNGFVQSPSIDDECGGAIRNFGSLTMSDFAVSRSQIFFGSGGGICNRGSLALAKGQVNGNWSVPDGGGIWSVGDVSLVAVTVMGNQAEFYGGGIHSEGTLTIADSTISENHTTYAGGGISIRAGTADLMRVRVIANTTTYQGAGVFNSVDTAVADSTISGNRVDNARPEFPTGGGGFFNSGMLSISRTTISGNTVAQTEGTGLFAGGGGGISNDRLPLTAAAPTLRLANTTISANSANDGGGVHYGAGAGTATNLTISNNIAKSAGGGVYSAGGVNATFVNTVVANNTGANCSGTATSLGHNLDSDGTCDLTSPGDMRNVDPLLGPLADNGGPTMTHALLEGSPAIDAGSPATPGSGGTACEATDQRGVARPQGLACDIGAYESSFRRPPSLLPVTGGAPATGAAANWPIVALALGAGLTLVSGLLTLAARKR